MRWPLQPLQPLQQTQLQPLFGQSVDSLCHPWFTTTNVSYRFPILKLPPPPRAVLLVLYVCIPWRETQMHKRGESQVCKRGKVRCASEWSPHIATFPKITASAVRQCRHTFWRATMRALNVIVSGCKVLRSSAISASDWAHWNPLAHAAMAELNVKRLGSTCNASILERWCKAKLHQLACESGTEPMQLLISRNLH